MGKSLTQWQRRIEGLVRDAGNKDVAPTQVRETGIIPALAQFSIDRPRTTVVEVAGAGSAYFDLPAGWTTDFSRLEAVEFPAGKNPPEYLDSASWQIVRKPADVTVEQILLDRTPTSTEKVRFAFTVAWPTPDSTAATDKLNDVAFEAVAALAASKVLVHLASEAARGRAGALGTDFADGRDRARLLMDAARAYRGTYDSFLGLRGGSEAGGAPGGAAAPPASRPYDYDPSRDSLFHGGRR